MDRRDLQFGQRLRWRVHVQAVRAARALRRNALRVQGRFHDSRLRSEFHAELRAADRVRSSVLRELHGDAALIAPGRGQLGDARGQIVGILFSTRQFSVAVLWTGDSKVQCPSALTDMVTICCGFLLPDPNQLGYDGGPR